MEGAAGVGVGAEESELAEQLATLGGDSPVVGIQPWIKEIRRKSGCQGSVMQIN